MAQMYVCVAAGYEQYKGFESHVYKGMQVVLTWWQKIEKGTLMSSNHWRSVLWEKE